MTGARPSRRVWIDLTNSPHVVFFRPILRRLDDAGVETFVTARDFAQTLGLLQLFGIRHTVVGRHGGARVAGKAVGLARRSFSLIRFGRGKRIRQAVSHGSNDLAVAARMLGIHSTVLHDYEGAATMHRINFRLADKIMVPDVIPFAELRALGLDERKHRPYAGIKEQVSLADFVPDPGVLDTLGLDRARPVAVLRPPATMSLYHRFANPFFAEVLESLLGTDAQVVLLPRTPDQKREFGSVRGVVVPERPVDGPSLVYAADLVISAGGTMNREAAVLGTPAWSIFEGRLGGVDEMLMREGRLHRLRDPADINLRKKGPGAIEARRRRDPADLLSLALHGHSARAR